MRIAVDLDGVVFDSEMYFMTMGEIYDCKELKGNHIVCPDEGRVQEKFNWSPGEVEEYVRRYACTEEFSVMPGAALVIGELKKNPENAVYIVSARGQYSEQEILIARKKLETAGIRADGYYWCCKDKAAFCAENKIDVIIDDNFYLDEPLRGMDTVFIHFHMVGKRKPEKRQKLYSVQHWGEVYRVLHSLKAIEF